MTARALDAEETLRCIVDGLGYGLGLVKHEGQTYLADDVGVCDSCGEVQLEPEELDLLQRCPACVRDAEEESAHRRMVARRLRANAL